MTYEIDLEHSVSRGTLRAYRKALKKALGALDEPASSDDPIHDGHTGVKKARTLLRILRPEIGGSRYRKETDALREAGHPLAAVRDTSILVGVLDGLMEHAGAEDRGRLAPLTVTLQAQRDEGEARAADVRVEATRVLTEARDRASAFSSGPRGWKALAPGIDRAYRRGRERFDRAFETGHDEDFHALRKAVKDLGYLARFLRRIDEPSMRIEEERFKQLGSLLGDDHDLAALRAVARRSLEPRDPEAADRLDALANARRDQLRREARPIADSLFAESPKQRLGRLEALFRDARARAVAAVRTPQAA